MPKHSSETEFRAENCFRQQFFSERSLLCFSQQLTIRPPQAFSVDQARTTVAVRQKVDRKSTLGSAVGPAEEIDKRYEKQGTTNFGLMPPLRNLRQAAFVHIIAAICDCGQTDQFRTIIHLQLQNRVSSMLFDGFDCDSQLSGNLFVRTTTSHKANNFGFSLSQTCQFLFSLLPSLQPLAVIGVCDSLICNTAFDGLHHSRL